MPSTEKSENITETLLIETKQRLFDQRRLLVPVSTLQEISLPLYLLTAILQAIDLHRLRGTVGHDWQTPAWDFGRFAKAHPDLIHLPSDAALRLIKTMLPAGFWEKYLRMNTADGDMAFDAVWNDCWSIPGYDPLTVAVMKARKTADAPDPHLPAGYGLFLETIRILHEDLGGEPILLPCHTLAPLLECEPMTVSRYRSKAVRDGFLQIIKPHRYRPEGRGEATQFRYVG